MKYAIILASLAFLFVSCNGDTTVKTDMKKTPSSAVYKDGTYKATFDQPDTRGWNPYIEVLVKEGKVVSANFDYVNEAGDYKSQDLSYAENMKGKTGVAPAEAANLLVDALVEMNSAEVDGVTGATSTSTSFKTLSKAALEKALVGDTAPQVLPWPAE